MKLLYSFAIVFLTLTPQNDSFVFQQGRYKMTLTIDDGKSHIEWGEKAVLNFKMENINPKYLSISAPGLRVFGNRNNLDEVNCEVVPDRNMIKNDTLKLNIVYKDSAKNLIRHQFLIAIK